MEELNKLITITEENQRLLRLINEKQDHLFGRLDELEGRIRVSKFEEEHITPPDSDTETFKAETHLTKTVKNLSFSESINVDGDLKDTMQMPPIFELKNDHFEFKIEEKPKDQTYCGSIYYSYSKSKCERICSVECTFKKSICGNILEIKGSRTIPSDVSLQIFCGIKESGVYDIEDRVKYAIVKIKPNALVSTKLDVRLILLKFNTLAEASSVFKGLCS